MWRPIVPEKNIIEFQAQKKLKKKLDVSFLLYCHTLILRLNPLPSIFIRFN